MTWYTLYHDGTGALLGHGTSCREPDPGETRIEHQARQDQGATWNPETKAWEAVATSRKSTIDDLWSRLTEAEQIAYYSLPPSNSSAAQIDAAIVRNRSLASGRIDLDSPVISGMLDLLILEGIITADRKNEILA